MILQIIKLETCSPLLEINSEMKMHNIKLIQNQDKEKLKIVFANLKFVFIMFKAI